MKSSTMRTANEPKLHRVISRDDSTRHFGPHKNGCLNASVQLPQKQSQSKPSWKTRSGLIVTLLQPLFSSKAIYQVAKWIYIYIYICKNQGRRGSWEYLMRSADLLVSIHASRFHPAPPSLSKIWKRRDIKDPCKIISPSSTRAWQD